MRTISLRAEIPKTDKKTPETKVCVAGLGQVGLPVASFVLGKGFEVWGYDLKDSAVKRAREKGIKATTNWDEIPPADVYVITVSTLLKDDVPDLAPVFDVCEKIAQKANRALVSIESTVIPGTCRKIFNEIFRKKLDLVHIPHRYWAGDPIEHGVKQMRVIGGIDEKSLRRGQEFFGKSLDIPLFAVSPIEVAEMCKIAENAYRYIQIAFAEELRQICEEIGLSFNELRKACNTKWNIEMLEARDGIGGHCLPKDVKYLSSLTPHNALLQSAVAVDDAYRKWLEKKTR